MKTIALTSRVAPVAAHPARPLAGLLKLIARWIEVRRQRRQLAELSDELLRDIGITRVEAEAEAGRPFWDADR